jgi:hypothetical protein
MLNSLERLGAWIAKRFGAPINTSAALILAVYTFVWGLWLVNPFWNVFEHAALYSQMAEVMPEWIWGSIAITVGVTMGVGIVRHTFSALTRGALAGWVHWFVISIFYFLGDWKNTGGITATAFAVYCGFIYLNLMVNRVNPKEPDDIL